MKKKFRYFLQQTDTGLFYQEQSRNVIASASRTPIRYDPIDWSETTLRFARGNFFGGVFRTLALSITFVKDARRILAYVAATQRGYASKCRLIIEKLNTTTQLYLPYFEGDIDFSQGRLSKDQYQLEILDGGLASLLMAKENTPYEIAINPGGAIRSLMDGIFLRTSYTYVPLGLTWQASLTPGLADAYYTIPAGFVLQEGDYEVGATNNQMIKNYIAASGGLAIGATLTGAFFDNFSYRASQDMSVVLDGEMQVSFKAGNLGSNYRFSCHVMVGDGNGVIKSFNQLYRHPVITANNTTDIITFSFFQQLNLVDSDRVYILFYGNGQPDLEFKITGNPKESQIYKFAIRSTFRLPTTECIGDRYYEYMRKMITKITGRTNAFRSDYLSNQNIVTLDNKPWNTIVTSGDALRRIGTTSKPAVIKSNIGDALKHAMDMWLLDLGVEKDAQGNEIIRVEHKSYFFNNNLVIVDLGEVPYPGQSFIQDMIYGGLKVGVAKQDYDGLNGKDEPNMEQVWDFPVLQRPGSLWDMVSPYRWDMYGIEYTRSKYIEKKTTDDSSDDSVFLFEINDNPSLVNIGGSISGFYYTLARKQNSGGATGLMFPATAYNLSMSPKRNLLRNGPVIHAALWQQDGQKITFQTNNKNADLISNLGSGQIVERMDIPVESLAAPLYLPKLFEFTTPAPDNLPELIATNPYGRINFSVRIDGQLVPCGGFIDEVRLKPGTNEAAEWSLIVCPDVDLSRLI